MDRTVTSTLPHSPLVPAQARHRAHGQEGGQATYTPNRHYERGGVATPLRAGGMAS